MAQKRIGAVTQAFSILEALGSNPNATPTQVSRSLDMPVSTVYDYLSTLESEGCVKSEDGRYAISAKMLTYGSLMRLNEDLYTCAKPVVKQLARETNEQAAVGISENGQIFFLYIQNDSEKYDIHNYPGMTLPLHASASGKIALAYSDENLLGRLGKNEMKAFTSRTNTDEQSLREELRTIREQGYARNKGEYEEGFETVAAPIRLQGELVGVVTVTALFNRMKNSEYEAELIDSLLEASDVIEINLGDHPNIPE